MTKITKTRLPRYKKAKTPPPMRLTDRDKQVVEIVYQLRFLTSEQIKYWKFEEGSMTACRRRLGLLYHNGYLAGINKVIPTGYGSSKRVYCLSKKGAALITHLYGEKEAREIKWNEKHNKVEPFFIEHILAINDVQIAFLKAALKTNDYQLDWFKEQIVRGWTGKVDDPENSGKILPVTPDAFIHLRGKDKQAYYFLEVDRATESNHRWRDKIKGYVEYVKSGMYKKKFGTDALRVLTVTTTPDRMNNLIKTTQSVENAYFFLFATSDQMKSKDVIFKPVWKTTEKEDLISLL